MLPIPTHNAIFAFVGSVLVLGIALLGQSQTATVLAGGALLGLCAAFALTASIGDRLRSERIEFAWWLGHAQPSHTAGAVVGVPFEVHCQMKNHSQRPLRLRLPLPIFPPHATLLGEADSFLELPPRSRSEFAFRLSANAAGRVVLQGLAVAALGPFGLFMAPLYFPNPLSLKVLPRSAARTKNSAQLASGEPLERSGLTAQRRRGSGFLLHELREYRPGDAFKSIAWKNSARVGRVLVREVEREVQNTLHIVLDVSGTMRGGAPGQRPLDQCIELAAWLAEDALSRGDRVGLTAVDGRVVSYAAEGEGMRQMLRVYDALLATTEVVDSDLTAIDDLGVTALVGRYMKQQEGRDYGQSGDWDVAGMARHAAGVLPTDGEKVVATGAAQRLLRRYCKVRGLLLPYRAETRAFAKAEGLAQALRQAAGTSRTPRTLIVLSDLDGSFELDPLLSAVRLLRMRQHNLTFILPDYESCMAAPESELARDLRGVYRMQGQRRFSELRAALGNLGARTLRYDAREGAHVVARQTARLRRVA